MTRCPPRQAKIVVASSTSSRENKRLVRLERGIEEVGKHQPAGATDQVAGHLDAGKEQS